MAASARERDHTSSATVWSRAMAACVVVAAACVGPSESGAASRSTPAASPRAEVASLERVDDRIVFVANRAGSSATRIYSIRPDGSGRVRLTDGTYDRSPAQAPDGKTVVFTRYSSFSPPRAGLYAVGSNGRGLRRLTRSQRADSDPTWDPGGSRVAFVRSPFRPAGADEDYSAIYVLDVSEGSVTPITDMASRNDNPSWAPDGTRIAFSSNRTDLHPSDPEAGRWDVWLANSDGSEATNLTRGASGQNPSWAPDGTAIVYERYEEAGSNLWVTDPEGLAHRRLTSGCEYTEDASWSHDSKWVAYTIASSGCTPMDEDRPREHVAIVRVSDGKVLDVDGDLRGSFSPSWSPGSNTLVFVGRSRAYDLFRFDVGKRRLRRLTSGAAG